MKTLLIYMEPETLRQLRIKCAEKGLKMTAVIRDLVKKFLRDS